MALKNDFNTSVFTGQDVTVRSSEYAPAGTDVGDIVEVSVVATHEFPALNQWAAINYPLYYANTITSGANANNYFTRFQINGVTIASIMKKASFATAESAREAAGFRCIRTLEIVASVPVTANIALPTVSHTGGPFKGDFTFTASKASGADYLIVAKRDLNGITASTGGTANHFSTSNFSGTISNECVVLVASGYSTDLTKWAGNIIIFWNDA